MSVWQCRATMNILSSPNNSKTSILDFPPPNAKCDKKSKTLIALRVMQQLIFNQTFTARFYCSFLFSAPGTVMLVSVEEALLAIMIMPIMIVTNHDQS